MKDGKYLRLTHFLPDGHPEVYPGNSDEVRQIMINIVEKVMKGWTAIPGHDLEVFWTHQSHVPILSFRKNGKEVYIHIFRNEYVDNFLALNIVIGFYEKYKLGKVAFKPDEPNWMHTIPVPGTQVTPADKLLIHQIAQSLFWTVQFDYKKHLGGGGNA